MLFLALADDEGYQKGYLGSAYRQHREEEAIYPGVNAVYPGVQRCQPVPQRIGRLPAVIA